MSKYKQLYKIIICVFAILTIIFHGNLSMIGAREGIKLCAYTVLPALFPYCVLSIWLRSMLTNNSSKYMRPLEKITNLPNGCGPLLLLGLLGGYPIGAICVEQEFKEKRISSRTANYMRIICNNAGPSFILGIITASFTNVKEAYFLLLIQTLSSILLSVIFLKPTKRTFKPHYEKALTFTTAIRQAVSSMVNVCATVIMFRVFLSIVNNYSNGAIGHHWFVVITGIIELTNGAIALKEIPCDAMRFIAAAGLISFGGLCVHIQTISVSTPGSYKYYLSGSMIKSGISIILASLYVNFQSIYLMLVIYTLTFIAIKIIKHLLRKKTVAIPNKIMYNTSTS